MSSAFEWFVLTALAVIALSSITIASAAEKRNRHLSNIADRLLDLWQQRER